jgi:hypothetical protein
MNADIAIFLLKDGAVTGAIYALLAIASIMTFAVTRVVFLPQGDLISFAALTLAALQAKSLPGTVWLILIAAACCLAIDIVAAVRSGRIRSLSWDGVIHLGWPVLAGSGAWLYVRSGWSSVTAEITLAAPHRPVRVSELSARLRAAAGRIDPDAPDRRRRGPFRVARDRILFFLAPKAFGCRLMSAVHSNWGQ